jgi:molecular chaperone HscA
VFEVLATGGDSALGGDDFDRRIVDWALRNGLGAAAGDVDPIEAAVSAGSLTPVACVCCWWRLVARRRRLSSQPQVDFLVKLSDATSVSCRCRASASRRSHQTLIERTLASTRRALRDAEAAAGRGAGRGHGGRRDPHAAGTQRGRRDCSVASR